jgi:hypothetical protein
VLFYFSMADVCDYIISYSYFVFGIGIEIEFDTVRSDNENTKLWLPHIHSTVKSTMKRQEKE